jgi:hypothetical protein
MADLARRSVLMPLAELDLASDSGFVALNLGSGPQMTINVSRPLEQITATLEKAAV